MKQNTPIPVVLLYGPTACGKTQLADSLFSSDYETSQVNYCCSPFKGCVEIVSADSVQVYKGLRIGAAQPDKQLCKRLPHHLVGFCDPAQEFSVADFVARADVLCSEIYARGKLPVILGGTGFYIKHFMYGLPITPQADPLLRVRIQERLTREGAAALHKELETFDPISAKKIHVNDAYRIVRAHEVFEATGKPLSYFSTSTTYRAGYRFCPLYLTCPRAELYRRIEQRTDAMFTDGLLQEFTDLYCSGYREAHPAMKAIGYHEFFEANPLDPIHAKKEIVIELIKKNTKRYAKRQQTFFQTLPCFKTINLYDKNADSEIITTLKAFYT
ncbi:MAG: tRNA (adenosine(37)-N6)-dimethylallyltransferase MiaA [Treponema sp.]